MFVSDLLLLSFPQEQLPLLLLELKSHQGVGFLPLAHEVMMGLLFCFLKRAPPRRLLRFSVRGAATPGLLLRPGKGPPFRG